MSEGLNGELYFALEEKTNTLVLGVGNILLNDEGAGIEVIRLLENEGLAGADLLDGGTGGFHLLGLLQSYKRIIIVDASLDSFDEGHVRVIHPKFATDFPLQLSAHEIGLKDLIEATYLLGGTPDYYLVAISVKNFQDMDMEISPVIRNAIRVAADKVRELVIST